MPHKQRLRVGDSSGSTRRAMMETTQADIPSEIRIGSLTLVRVHPDMVRIYNEVTGDALTMKEREVEDVLLMAVECR